MDKVKVISFSRNFRKLTKKLANDVPKDYEYNKIMIWLMIYNENTRVIKWLKPKGSGTIAKCKPFENKEDNRQHFEEIRNYVNKINSEFGTNYAISLMSR